MIFDYIIDQFVGYYTTHFPLEPAQRRFLLALYQVACPGFYERTISLLFFPLSGCEFRRGVVAQRSVATAMIVL